MKTLHSDAMPDRETGNNATQTAADPQTENEVNDLRLARHREFAVFQEAIKAAYTHASTQLELRSRELANQIVDDFYNRVQRWLWVIGFIAVVATLGGFVTLREVVAGVVEQQIASKTRDIDRLTASALDDVVNLRTESKIALEQSKRAADEAQTEVKATLAGTTNTVKANETEMNAQIAKARKLILETATWWEEAKFAKEQANADVKGQRKPPTDDEKARNEAVRRIMKCLKDAGVNDPDVDLWVALFENNTAAMESAVQRGANVVTPDVEVMKRHKDVLAKHCPGFMPSWMANDKKP